MWKPSQDVKGGGGPDESKFYDRPSQRRRWDSLADPKLLPSDLEYSPPRSSRWDASTQVPSERRLQQRPKICLEYKSSSSRPLQWDVSTQVPSEPKSRPSHIVEHHSSPSRPARIAGGNGCNCCPCPPTPCERPVESCLPGLHQKYVDVYDTKGHAPEGHLPAGYRRFVEHDDLYLPPSRALSPASTDHDDLYLPLKTNEYSPRDCCPCDLRMCDSDPTYGDIYLPPSRPCTPAFPKDPCGYQPPCPPPCCPPPPCRPCPPPPCSPPPRQSSCGPKIVCSCPPYIKKLAPCPAPPSNDCSCSPYIKKLSGCSPPPSRPPSPPPAPSCRPGCCRPVQQCSSVYIDEVPSPPPGTRYVACQECLCHKDISTRSLCPSPKKISPCRDCVCHLGARSPSQGGRCPPKGAHTRCQAGFQTPGKPRLKINLNQSAQCLECKSPYNCKGPPNCNPQYILETPLSPNSARSRSPSPGLRPRSPMGAGKCSAGPPPSSRCQSCDCHKGGSSSNKCGGPPKVSPKLLEDPCCSPCRPSPCRPLLAAEMLSGMEACVSQAKACGANPASCMDTRCGSCDCHKPKCPPPPSPPCSPCSKPSPPPCRAPPPSCSPCRSPGPSCFDDDVHNPTFKSFQSTSPRCKDCDCHKPKNCKLSSQICKFCRGAGWCYCEYHTTLQLLTDSNSEPQTSPHHDKNSMEVEETVVSQVSGISPENTYRSSDLSARSAKLEYNESPRDEEIEQISRSPMKDIPSQSDIIQLCCCGECEYTKPRFPMKTECPFCKHTHSCCCGMCSCPIPTCSSKTPLDGPLSRGVSVNSSGALTGRSNPPLYSYRPKSVSQQLAPRKKLGFTSPDKSTPKPFTTSNSQLSNARLCYSSPKTRMKQSPTRR
ncbi:hypothetical protein M758_4G263800 [Ceratodon purpureus]|nr:hypothetical protein M758_4G263800 [Ceratodon purpureus]